jgi:hypothetical protein
LAALAPSPCCVATCPPACLPARPPACLCPQTTFKETTPPEEPLILRSQIVRIKESDSPGNKATVQVSEGGE